MAEPIIQFEKITKRFPGVLALRDVSFAVEPGQVHALVGENGAGKSTLGKILAGIYAADGGWLLLDGQPLSLRDPRHALSQGIGMVHQELSFCENMTVAENLCLAEMPRVGPFVRRKAMRARAAEMLGGIGLEIDVNRRIGELTVALQQMIQIAQAVAVGARVIVFDEPTSSLTGRETDRLFDLIAQLKQRGVTMLYVSHRMSEIFRLGDTVTVLRDGQHVATQPVAETTEAKLVEQMIGRPLEEYFPRHLAGDLGPEVLRVESLRSPGKFADVSFRVRAGEVLGLAGLVGAGRSEIAQAIFGLDGAAGGQVFLHGEPVRIRSPREAMAHGIALAPEDRKRQGLVLGMGGKANTTLPILKSLASLSFIRRGRERAVTREYFDRLRVRTPSIETPVMGLSGGNQQKVVLAKWLAAKPKVLIVDEPTRGVDVGAKAEIHGLIDQLAQQGAAVLLISSELPELLNLSTRIAVLREGCLVGELPRADATQDSLMRLMAGVG